MDYKYVTKEELDKKIEFMLDKIAIFQCIYFCSGYDLEELVVYLTFDVEFSEMSKIYQSLDTEEFYKKTYYADKEDKLEDLITILKKAEIFCAEQSLMASDEELEWLLTAASNCNYMINKCLYDLSIIKENKINKTTNFPKILNKKIG
jgi:hypothetical protein